MVESINIHNYRNPIKWAMISIQSRKYYAPSHMTKSRREPSFNQEIITKIHIFQCDRMKVVLLIFLNPHQGPHIKYTNCNGYRCRIHSPGQRAILQGLWCVSGPSHGLPPYWGGVHDLVLVLWPRPHVNEHKLHGDHSSQTPCTVIKQRSFNNKSREVKSKIFFSPYN